MSNFPTTPVAAQVNPSKLGLQIVTGIGLVLGLILLVVGLNIGGQVDDFSGRVSLPGIPVIIVGGALLNIGIVALFALLTVNAILWRPTLVEARATADPRGALGFSLRPVGGTPLLGFEREVWYGEPDEAGSVGGSLRGVTATFVPADGTGSDGLISDDAAKNSITVVGPEFAFTYTGNNDPTPEQSKGFTEITEWLNSRASLIR